MARHRPVLAGTDTNGTSYAGCDAVLGHFRIENAPCSTVGDIEYAISQGWPVLLSLQAYQDKPGPFEDDWDDGHYVVAIGIDGDRIIFEDPSSYKRTWLTREELERRWHDVNKGRHVSHWGRIIQCPAKYHYNDMEHMG